jgi:type IV pilus assembly protein PilA
MHRIARNRARGFKVLDLMIVFAATTLILSLVWPSYSDYAVRSKLTEAIMVAHAAKQAVGSTCMVDPAITMLDNHRAGFQPKPSVHVRSVSISGGCRNPTINLIAQATGESEEIEFRIIGRLEERAGNFSWTCIGNAPAEQLPSECRGANSEEGQGKS